MDFQLKQRGRASIDFAADLTAIAGGLGASGSAGVQDMDLAEDMATRDAQISAVLDRSTPYWFARQVGEWSSVSHGEITGEAFEEIKEALLPEFQRLAAGPTTIEADPDCDYPDYWTGVDFHRTTGGWVREHQGFIHGELIHPLYVGKNFPGSIFKQRLEVLNELGARDYARIVELGTSSGHYTLQLAERYPDADITGVELGLPMLEQAQRFANERGLRWRLVQAPAEKTGLPGGAYDLVTSYILLHEVPAAAQREIFAEAFRLLEPGGTVFMSDIRPHRDLTRFEEWRSIDMAARGGEPYWVEAAELDLARLAEDVGFVEARSYGLGERHYPWVTVAQKPEG